MTCEHNKLREQSTLTAEDSKFLSGVTDHLSSVSALKRLTLMSILCSEVSEMEDPFGGWWGRIDSPAK